MWVCLNPTQANNPFINRWWRYGIADLGFYNSSTDEFAAWTMGSDGSVTAQGVLADLTDTFASDWSPVAGVPIPLAPPAPALAV